jgi:hypothetical protein
MAKKELEELKNDYRAVFYENGEVKACGRALCMKLMYSLKKFAPKADLGNFDTGVMNVEAIKAEYLRLISQ